MHGITLISVILAKLAMNTSVIQKFNFKPFTCLPCLSFWTAFALLLIHHNYHGIKTFAEIEFTIMFGAYTLGLIFFKLKL